MSLEPKGATPTKGPKEAAVDRAVDISRLDIRVGRIVSAEKVGSDPDKNRLSVPDTFVLVTLCNVDNSGTLSCMLCKLV